MTAPIQKASKADKANTLKEIISFSQEYFAKDIGKTLDAIERELISQSEMFDQPAEKNYSLDKSTEVRESRINTIEIFKDTFSNTLTGNIVIDDEPEDDGDLTLSLLDDDDLEENILISNLSARVEDKYEMSLRAVKRGIMRINRSIDDELDADALSPKSLGHFFQKSISDINLSLKHKPFVYNTLFSICLNNLEHYYQGVLTLLLQSHIIKDSENPASANFDIISQYKQAKASLSQTKIRSQDPDDDSHDLTISDLTSADGTVDGTIDHTIAAAFAAIEDADTTSLKPAAHKPLAATQAKATDFAQNSLSKALYELITSNASESSDTNETISSNVILDNLSKLQSIQSKNTNTDVEFKEPKAIANLVNAKLNTLLKDENKTFSNSESNVISIINKLFIAILDDPLLSSPIKIQISRLQIPYIKIGLIDIKILNEEAHPARLLLNEIASLGVGINNANDPTLEKIQDIVQNIIDNFESDLDIFERLLGRIRTISKALELQTTKTEEQSRKKAEQQAKLASIKKAVTMQLRKFLAGKKLPKTLYDLVLKGFAPLFVTRFQKFGGQSKEWKEPVKLFNQIIQSVQPQQSIQSLGLVVERGPQLIVQSKRMLAEVVAEGMEQKLVAHLENLYLDKAREYKKKQSALDTLKKQGKEIPLEEQVAYDPFALDNTDSIKPETEMQKPEAQQALLKKLPSHLKPGTWCEIYINRQQGVERLKLSSIIKDIGQLIFANAAGKATQIKDINTFLEELDCEQSRILSPDNLFDKALAAVISNMRAMHATEQNQT